MSNPRLNHLIDKLPEKDYAQFLPHLELCSMVKGQILVDIGQMPRYVYFPIDALVSIIAELEDGFKVMTVLVGRQSMVGLSYDPGAKLEPSIFRAKVCGSGLAYRMQISAYVHFSQQSCAFQRAIIDAYRLALRRAHIVMACAQHHSLEQQLIRWFLTCVRQIQVHTIEVTHAELSEVLGFSREIITLTLGKLAQKGWISLSRGAIQVLKPAELERQACECYWLVQGQHRPLFQLKNYA